MPDTLTLYTNPMSRGQIARWMLEEIGQPYEQVVLDYGPAMKDPAYLAINPMGKVPALKHGDAVITECAAICAYLADVFPAANLGPKPEEKARYYRWLFFSAGPVEQAVTNRSLGFEVASDKMAMAGYGSYDQMVAVLESAVSQSDFIAGDRFTAADVYVGSQVLWGIQFGSLPQRDAFAAYAARLMSRPNYQRAKAIDEALMASVKR